MELSNGKITPTSVREASVFSGFLKAQATACGRSAAEATKAEKDIELSSVDSYHLFCGLSRALLRPETQPSQRQMDVVEVAIKGLAGAYLDEARVAVEKFSLDSGSADESDLAEICRLASKTVTPYEE